MKDILKQILGLVVAVFVVMAVIYVVRHFGQGIPVVRDIVAAPII